MLLLLLRKRQKRSQGREIIRDSDTSGMGVWSFDQKRGWLRAKKKRNVGGKRYL